MAHEDTPTIERDGWCLLSAEKRHAASPETTSIPSKRQREGLLPGDAAKLLFDIETRDARGVVGRVVHRMWVIVKKRDKNRYLGVLDNDPGNAKSLVPGTLITFSSVHVLAIDHPPRGYILEKYGLDFFQQ